MGERARNVAVGLTVMVAIGILIGMVMLFTVVPAMFQSGYTIKIKAPATMDVQSGMAVNFAGLRVGYISDVRFVDETDPTRGVAITAIIEKKIRLPGNTRVAVSNKGLVGSAYINLLADGPARIDPRTGKPLAELPRDGSVELEAVATGSDVIPPDLKLALEDIRGGFHELGKLARTLNEVIAEPAPSGAAATQPSRDIRSMLARVSILTDGLANIFGDPNTQADIKGTMANLAKASADAPELVKSIKSFVDDARKTLATVNTIAEKAGPDLEQLTKKLLDDADRLAVLMTSLNRITAKLEGSDGTAGLMLNDPKLYNNLLEITTQVNGLMKEFRVLVETWEKSGVGIKLK